MIRFIIKRHWKDDRIGFDTVSHYTLDAEVPELEGALRSGGIDAEAGAFDFHDLVAAEILRGPGEG